MMSKLNYCLLLVFLVGFIGATKFRCDYSFSKVGWFKYHRIPATWSDARLRCHYEGGVLASPTSHEIISIMREAIRDVDIFTGIHAQFSPGNYYTIDGIPLETISHRWAENEPNNDNDAERCISFNSEGNISDVSCDTPRPYMCFRPKTLPGATACGTPDTEYRFEKKTNKCYKFHETPRTYERAHFICSAEGGHLAIINSVTESRVIREIFAKHPAASMIGSFWKDVAFIGFNNWGESSDWTTIHGQSLQEAGFSKFSGGEPNNDTAEFCGSVYRNGYLNDLSCDRSVAFICEKDTNYPAVCDSDHFEINTTESYLDNIIN